MKCMSKSFQLFDGYIEGTSEEANSILLSRYRLQKQVEDLASLVSSIVQVKVTYSTQQKGL